MALNTISYDKHEWQTEEIIRSSTLNHAESAIESIASNLSNTNSYINGLNFNSNNGSNIKTPTTITQSGGQLNVVWENIRTGTTGQSGIVQLSSSPSSSESFAATPAGVQAAINTLDTNISGFSASKTLASLTETDGIISATVQSIAIPYSAITNPPTLGAAAEKAVDTVITSSTNSANLPTSAAVATFVANSILEVSASGNNITVNAGTGLNGSLSNNVYTVNLATAGENTIGGIKVGSNLSIDSNGVLSATDTTYDYASSNTAGIIKVGNGLGIDASGNLYTITNNYSAGDGITITNNIITNNGIITLDAGSDPGELVINSNTSIYVPAVSEANASTGNLGLIKLYTDIGENQDGAVHQDGLTNIIYTLIENFGLTLSMPTTVTWNAEDELQAEPDRFDDDTTVVVIQKYRNGSWVTYNGEARTAGERFRAMITRTVLGLERSEVIGQEYVEPEPQEEPEEP